VSSRFVFTSRLIGGRDHLPAHFGGRSEQLTCISRRQGTGPKAEQRTRVSYRVVASPVHTVAMGKGWEVTKIRTALNYFQSARARNMSVIRGASESLLIKCQYCYTLRKFFFIRNNVTLRTAPFTITSLYHCYSLSSSMLTDKLLKFRHNQPVGQK
jgi:hypothetical protein